MLNINRLNKYRFILASRSPRRKHLLEELGLRFDVVVKDWTETYPQNLRGKEIATFVAKQKADSFRYEMLDNEIVITADTIVWCNEKVLDKPFSKEDAVRYLKEISDNTHEVITGVCLLSNRKSNIFSSVTKVTFDPLTESDIDFYIDKYKPFDKAGAYGIQEWIGLAACSRIEGSYFNVMGLPVNLLYRELLKFISDDNR